MTLAAGDTFRRTYRTLTDERKRQLDALKAAAEALEAQILVLNPPDDYLHGRETALALTKLEECVMWATKAAT